MAEKIREIEVARGGTVRFVIYAREIDADITDMVCTGALRELPAGQNDLVPGTEVAAQLEPEDFPGDDERGPGWFLVLTGEASTALDAGKRYLGDGKITVGGEPYFTRRWILDVYEPAS